MTPPSDDSDDDDDNDKNMHGRKHAEIGRRQQPIDATPEMEDLEDGHKTMDTLRWEEKEYDDRKEAGPCCHRHRCENKLKTQTEVWLKNERYWTAPWRIIRISTRMNFQSKKTKKMAENEYCLS